MSERSTASVMTDYSPSFGELIYVRAGFEPTIGSRLVLLAEAHGVPVPILVRWAVDRLLEQEAV